jgi:hypothetical protein
MAEATSEAEGLGHYRRVLGEAEDNQVVFVADGLCSDGWIEELDEAIECRGADGAQRERLREAFDFALALQALDADHLEVEYLTQDGIILSIPRFRWRAVVRTLFPWARALALR